MILIRIQNIQQTTTKHNKLNNRQDMNFVKVITLLMLSATIAFLCITKGVNGDKMGLLQAAVDSRLAEVRQAASVEEDILPEARSIQTMNLKLTQSCYETSNSRHILTTGANCPSNAVHDGWVGRWWQSASNPVVCDSGYITIKEWKTSSDYSNRRYRDASLGAPSGFIEESVFACILPVSSNAADTESLYELYKASTSDYAYTTNPWKITELIASGFTNLGAIGKVQVRNKRVGLKACLSTSSSLHNWVTSEESCPSGYNLEYTFSGTILTNCDGETDPNLTILYKYYSSTDGNQRQLGTSSTPPSGYNFTPVGCIMKPTTTVSAKIPIYSYSYVSGTDKDHRYESTSHSVSSPWTNDNLIIGYTASDPTSSSLNPGISGCETNYNPIYCNDQAGTNPMYGG